MIVVIDANVLVANPALDTPAWVEMRAAIAAKKVAAFVPDFVFIEAVAVIKRKRRDSVTAVRAQINPWGVRGKTFLGSTLWGLELEADQTESELRRALHDAGVTISKGPAVSHEVIVRRATGRVRPFDDKGSGYRDTLHWFFLLDLYERRGIQHDVVLVSNDVAAFGAPKSVEPNELHPDLVRDVRRIDLTRRSKNAIPRLMWRKALAHVDIPDVFVDKAVRPLDFLSAAELAGGVVAAVVASAPISVVPSLSPFGSAVRAAWIGGARSAELIESTAHRYQQRPQVIAVDFVADVESSFTGFGVSAPDSSDHRNLTSAGRIRATGRIDYDTNSHEFGEADITWSAATSGTGAEET